MYLQVFQYSIHVIVAGTTATWWHSPQECGCCSSAVNNSAIRTFTTSFGSICFGSLVVAIIQALKMLANTAQSEGEGNFLICIAQCLLACLASIIEYLNKWAFIFVGIYGMYVAANQSSVSRATLDCCRRKATGITGCVSSLTTQFVS
jgi:hypothetical protein